MKRIYTHYDFTKTYMYRYILIGNMTKWIGVVEYEDTLLKHNNAVLF